MRILAYSQILESYRSLTLDSLSRSFGMSVEFVDNELSRFIASGHLHSAIDKVHGIVETTFAVRDCGAGRPRGLIRCDLSQNTETTEAMSRETMIPSIGQCVLERGR
ncbi:hypothetical protein SCP_0301630 [Sparassis crispa]|uniref:PCI domain-containing protein n=1 Tax=Sparassis crispa TaxID=139825 RepID=A0A401GE38_9APHY|nr:hypothetical protein SCP_0301630 [Sparassis crispa]GBE80448.1 hypothetical protein SCP_0301630 [Sparassis crispa]